MGRGRQGTGVRNSRQEQGDYLRFAGGGAAITFMNNAYGASVAKLPAAEQNALDVWTHEGSNVHNSINSYLRHDIEPMSEYYLDRLADLDRSFKRRSAVLQHDIVAYRSFSHHFEEIKNLSPGTVFTDYGFASTTVVPNGLGWDTPNVEIRIPRRTRALWLAPFAIDPSEGELLLGRGTSFRVVGKNGDAPILEVAGQVR